MDWEPRRRRKSRGFLGAWELEPGRNTGDPGRHTGKLGSWEEAGEARENEEETRELGVKKTNPKINGELKFSE